MWVWAVVTLATAWALRRTWRRAERVTVHGLSMVPALQPGDHLVIWPTTDVRPGDIVAVKDPRRPERTVLKRVGWTERGEVYLLGDNAARSTDSREWGAVPLGSVRGRAVYRYAPPARAAWLARREHPQAGASTR
jgi:nickel-type superoxide dismutase maturation protease